MIARTKLRKPRNRNAALAAIAISGILALALAACTAQPTPVKTPDPASASPTEAAAQPENAQPSESFAVVAKDFTDNDPGPFTDTWHNRNILNAGNRGCAACHTSMYETIKNITVGDAGYEHVIGEPGYGRDYEWRDCTACHMTADAQMNGPNLVGAIHTIHFSSAMFEENGTCESCHAYNESGELVLWDDFKYTAQLGGSAYTDPATINQKLTERGVRNGSMVDVVWVDDVKLSDVVLAQPVSTNQDGSEYVFTAANMGVREYEAADYTVSLSGVNGKSSWTLDELKELPATEKIVTVDCAGNIQNGALISNTKMKGVLLADLIEAAGGLQDGMQSYTVTCKDTWTCFANCFGQGFNLQAALDQGAMLVYAYNDQELTPAQGYPLTLVTPGYGGAFIPKYVEALDFSTNESGFTSTWFDPSSASDGNLNAGWLTPNKDGMEYKVGDEITLEGWGYEQSSGGHELGQIAISGNYGNTWTVLDVRQGVDGFDKDQWVTFAATWTPEVAGTYVLHLKAVDSANPELAPVSMDANDNTPNYASVIIKVTE